MITVNDLNNFKDAIQNDLGAVGDYYDYLGNNGIPYGELAQQVNQDGGPLDGFYGDVADKYFEDKVRELYPGITDADIQEIATAMVIS